jgi:nucleotide-binding universal stress UspA family protein
MSQVLEKRDKTTSNLNIKEIVVAVDLSPHSEKTAAYAAKFAKSYGASITFVHAFGPERITEFTTQEVHENYEEEKRAADRELDKLAERVRETYPNSGRLVDHEPHND